MNDLNYLYDECYTIGCFDKFHHGHINLLLNMKKYSNYIIVGLHSSLSISKLKNLNIDHIDSYNIRYNNLMNTGIVNKIFLIDSTDPSDELLININTNNFISKLYIRADDYINFPGKNIIQKYMKIIYIPYTEGISSTIIRNNLY
jgi:cytidyltransferase-like protein